MDKSGIVIGKVETKSHKSHMRNTQKWTYNLTGLKKRKRNII